MREESVETERAKTQKKMEPGHADVKEVVILVGDDMGSPYPTSYPEYPNASARICRICHEEEEEEEQSSSSMESPCACSGSLKFAHRECVQRWCDEKGSTVCEICLKGYEPGYAVAPRAPAVVDVRVNNRRSAEATMQDHEPPERETTSQSQVSSIGMSNTQTSSAYTKGALYCRSLYMALATVLLLRHFFYILALGAQFHASTLFIVFVLRASGIILPIFVIMKGTMMVIQGMKSKQ